MQGDRLVVRPRHRQAAATLADRIQRHGDHAPPVIVAIAGESGSGKSETAQALADAFEQRGVPSLVIQQDDYFVYPPKTNDRKRRADIEWVGPQEVRLDLLDRNLEQIRHRAKAVVKPLVFYNEDTIAEETLDASTIGVAIVEGTYTMLLHNVDLRVFIARTYQETRSDRIGRAREAQDSFLERVLVIEHAIISRHKHRADIVIEADDSLREPLAKT